MGDRISFQFVNGTEKSVVFFAHWEGANLLDDVEEYILDLKKDKEERDPEGRLPLYRFEPGSLMVDFIQRYFNKYDGDRVQSGYYLGVDENDGDNSDNGHHVFNVGVEE